MVYASLTFLSGLSRHFITSVKEYQGYLKLSCPCPHDKVSGVFLKAFWNQLLPYPSSFITLTPSSTNPSIISTALLSGLKSISLSCIYKNSRLPSLDNGSISSTKLSDKSSVFRLFNSDSGLISPISFLDRAS